VLYFWLGAAVRRSRLVISRRIALTPRYPRIRSRSSRPAGSKAGASFGAGTNYNKFMPHDVVEAAEALLDQRIECLDKGFVRLVDYMGSDGRIVQSARVSYGAGTKSYREDRGLINYLMRSRSSSPSIRRCRSSWLGSGFATARPASTRFQGGIR